MKAGQGFVCFSIFIFFFSGCGSSSNVVCLSEKQIFEQEVVVDQARRHFAAGEYEEAIKIVEPLCVDRTTSLPLYQCELGLCCLANEDKEHAKDCLLKAYTSIEGFFDPATEKRAVSLWGAESDKVYKGGGTIKDSCG